MYITTTSVGLIHKSYDIHYVLSLTLMFYILNSITQMYQKQIIKLIKAKKLTFADNHNSPAKNNSPEPNITSIIHK